MMKSTNPATEQVAHTRPWMTDAEIEQKINEAHAASLTWRAMPVEQRCAVIKNLGAVLRKNVEAYALLNTQEMGKPLAQSKSEIEKCASNCDYYADHAAEFLAPKHIDTGRKASYITYQPVGTVLEIMPWNFPFWLPIRVGVPALAAGNALLLKHDPNMPACAAAIESACAEAGFPKGLVGVLAADIPQIPAVINHKHVNVITLTGSDVAGRKVASMAGAALKKTVMELGGSDPYIILEDADLAAAAKVCINARMNNCGQVCTAPKRLIVVDAIREQFTELCKAELSKFVMGDPMDSSTNMGPMARGDLRAKLHAQITETVKQGAKLLMGGEMPEGTGYYYPATLLADVKQGMTAFEDEIFGPVITIVPAKDEAEAIRLANATRFGLGAAIFTANTGHALRVAEYELEAGVCAVNGSISSDPRLPTGGTKDSGYGRELYTYGMHEFCNIKTVMMP